jgi:hypothetical protein
MLYQQNNILKKDLFTEEVRIITRRQQQTKPESRATRENVIHHVTYSTRCVMSGCKEHVDDTSETPKGKAIRLYHITYDSM